MSSSVTKLVANYQYEDLKTTTSVVLETENKIKKDAFEKNISAYVWKALSKERRTELDKRRLRKILTENKITSLGEKP